ncbi:hypothetical protein [Amnibacterium kyonggiense]
MLVVHCHRSWIGIGTHEKKPVAAFTVPLWIACRSYPPEVTNQPVQPAR